MTRMPTDTFTITVEVVPPACPDADFLHRKVAGIAVAREIRDRMRRAENPVAEGVKNAVEALTLPANGLQVPASCRLSTATRS